MNSIKELPFNVKLLNADKKRTYLIKPVTSTAIYDNSGGFDDNGLYSSSIFGDVNTPHRNKTFSYIALNTKLIHPFIYRELLKINSGYKDLIAKKKTFVWDKKEKDFIASVDESASHGYGFFMSHYNDIVFKSTASDKRQMRIDLLNKYRKESVLENHLVIPAGLRELEVKNDGREVEDEINPLYRKLLAISKSISKDEFSVNDPIYDVSRWKMQETMEEIFDVFYRMLTGKKGFIQGKFARRRVFDSTRNVISAMDISTAIMNGPKQVKSVDTIFGLFQTVRGILPLFIHLLRNDWLATVVSEGSDYANVVDPKTLKPVTIKMSAKAIENYMSLEGLEKTVMGFRYPEKRHMPVKLDGYYLGLVYKDHRVVKFFNDIDRLPESFNKDNVSPISLGELFYHCLYEKLDDIFAVVTRYPVTGEGSTYPCHAYVKTTVNTLSLKELDESWEIGDRVYSEWPKAGMEWIDTMCPSNIRLALLGADFDGDTMSATFLMSDEAVKECKARLYSKNELIDSNGKFFHGIVTDLCQWTLLNLTG